MKWPWHEPPSPWALGLLRAVVALFVWAECYASWRLPHHIDQPGVLLMGLGLTLSSTAMLLGWHGRWASGLTGMGMLVLHGVGVTWGIRGGGLAFDSVTTFELAITCVLLSPGPCSARVSIDALLGRGRGACPPWSQALLRVHTSITLGAVMVSHLDGLWLSGERLARMLMARREVLVEADPGYAAAAWLWVGLEALAVVAPWLPARPGVGGRSWTVWVATAFLLLQYPLLYTGTWSVHLAALVVFTARATPQPGPASKQAT